MSILNALTMRRKVLFAPIVAAALMVASALATFVGIVQLRSALQSIYQHRIPAMKNVAEADRMLAGVHSNTYKLLALMGSNFPADKVDAAARDIRVDLAGAKERLNTVANERILSTDEKQKIEHINDLITDYGKNIAEVIDIATVQVAISATYMSKAQDKYETLASEIRELRALEDRQAESAYRSAEATGVKAVIIVCAALLLSILLSGAAALFVSANIVRSIKLLSTLTAKLSEGDLSLHEAGTDDNSVSEAIDVTRKDEIGDLARSFKTMVAYLKEMAAASEAIARGDLSVEVTPRGEHDILGHAFERMNEGLADLVRSVRDGATQVASATGQIADASDQAARTSLQASTAIDEITSTMHEMNANVQSVVRHTQSQASSVSTTSASIDQMVVSIQRVADTSNVLLEIARRSQQEVQGGITSMDKASEGLNRINGSIRSSADLIDALGKRTDDIGKIIEVIDDIAEQTNLLALNAAIEAARAGEHGLGFAVVADEVRKLAERCASSTKDVSDLIEAIQKDMRKAVDNMEKSTDFVDQGLALGRDLGTALGKISTVVSEVHKYAQQIGVATNEQSSGSEQIGQATSRLAEITHEITSAVEEQASGSQAVVKTMDHMRELVQASSSSSTELAASAEQMTRMSQQLLDSMDRFKLPQTTTPAPLPASTKRKVRAATAGD